jgi:hypothetical protein
VEWVLLEDTVAAEHHDALGGTALSMVCLLGAHALGDKVGPRALREVLEIARPGDLEADSLR